MTKIQMTLAAVATALTVAAGSAMAADPVQKVDNLILSTQERTELRTRSQTATTAEEKLQIREATRKMNQERASTQGVNLPEMSQTQARVQARIQTQTRSMSGSRSGTAGSGMSKR